MKNLLWAILLISSSIFANTNNCLINKRCASNGHCNYKPESCGFSFINIYTFKEMNSIMSKEGYINKGLISTLYKKWIYVKKNSSLTYVKKFCLLSLQGGRRNKHYDMSCTDFPRVRTIFPNDNKILNKFLEKEELELVKKYTNRKWVYSYE